MRDSRQTSPYRRGSSLLSSAWFIFAGLVASDLDGLSAHGERDGARACPKPDCETNLHEFDRYLPRGWYPGLCAHAGQ